MAPGPDDPKDPAREGVADGDDRLDFGAAPSIGAGDDPENLWAFFAKRWLSVDALAPADVAAAGTAEDNGLPIIGQPDGDGGDDGFSS